MPLQTFVFQVVKIDANKKKVSLDNGWEVFYDKCLIATGGVPRNLAVLENAGEEVAERTTLFRKVGLPAMGICKLYTGFD